MFWDILFRIYTILGTISTRIKSKLKDKGLIQDDNKLHQNNNIKPHEDGLMNIEGKEGIYVMLHSDALLYHDLLLRGIPESQAADLLLNAHERKLV